MIVRREFGQWEFVLDIAKVVVPAATGVYNTYYQGTVAKDIAQEQAELQLQRAQLDASLRERQLQMLASTQMSQEASFMPSSLGGSVAGIPIWMILALAGGFFLLKRK